MQLHEISLGSTAEDIPRTLGGGGKLNDAGYEGEAQGEGREFRRQKGDGGGRLKRGAAGKASREGEEGSETDGASSRGGEAEWDAKSRSPS